LYSPRVETSGVDSIKEPLAFVTLAVFNEYATQRKNHEVSWQAAHSGEHHRLIWTVHCLLDEEVKGTGQGHSQKIAKEKAAREVWRVMGWSTVPTEPAFPPSSPSLPPPQPLPNQSSTLPAYSDDPNFSWVTVSIVNQTVQQQRRTIEWQQTATGKTHMPSWRVICLIDGQVMGIGDGKNTKEAKVIAARNAWKNMGWGGLSAATSNSGHM
jgi:dsRNA-specific ribonuclease